MCLTCNRGKITGPGEPQKHGNEQEQICDIFDVNMLPRSSFPMSDMFSESTSTFT
jgi:hypothetical protein